MSKFSHSCGLVASGEEAGLKPSAYMQIAGTEKAKKVLGFPTQSVGTAQTGGKPSAYKAKMAA